ncbi:SIS domain-containing protein [Actinoallomurus oryzae]|uniref:SIS domain-containing protein n=2 Tax=Actinoallomurus oryzae TaxID=502180 RepID=A0ABP8P5F9_9ACTN
MLVGTEPPGPDLPHVMRVTSRRRSEFVELIQEVNLETLGSIVSELWVALHEGRNIFTVGNGGSAATASHLATDIRSAVSTDCTFADQAKVWPLADLVSLTTATSNDYSYEDSFAVPLRQSLSRGDLLIAISVSGESPNVLRAVRETRTRGGRVVALTGRPTARLAADADVVVAVDHDDYGHVEDVHQWVCHAIAANLRSVGHLALNGGAR